MAKCAKCSALGLPPLLNSKDNAADILEQCNQTNILGILWMQCLWQLEKKNQCLIQLSETISQLTPMIWFQTFLIPISVYQFNPLAEI